MNIRSLTSHPARDPARGRAFTLVELLVIVAMIALLASMSWPGLGKTRLKTQGVYCMKNTRQLAQAWTMYATDNNDWLSPNRDGGDVLGWQSLTANWTKPVPYSRLSWAGGWLDFTANNTDNTNVYNLLFGTIGTYTAKSTDIYHCPADKYPARQGAVQLLRVRSYSMNGFVGDRKSSRTNGANDWYPIYVQFLKLSSFTRPGPAMTWLLLDEHPDSINDGWSIPTVDQTPGFIDLPASYHDGRAGWLLLMGTPKSTNGMERPSNQ